jgi:quinol monooxygenase YgiN
MLIVSGWIQVDPEARGDYLAGCRSVVEQARSSPGCVDFALSPDPWEAGRINVYELWESDESLETFRGAGPEPEQAAKILDARVAKYRISSVESP